METNLRSIAKDIQDGYLSVKAIESTTGLTSVQKEDLLSKLQRQYGKYEYEDTYADGMVYYIRFDKYYGKVDEIGTVVDVRATGTSPIRIQVGDNIFLSYEPRNLSNLSEHYSIDNSSFLHIKMGSEIRFQGDVLFGNYIYKGKKEGQFEFSIVNRKQSSMCFIATACYGNYDAPEVIILREYRDKVLLETYFGKLFVSFYYSVSPHFAALIIKYYWLKKLVRTCLLQPIIKRLQQKKLSH